jgi:uncharacterized protein YbjQ (UPF0145 family)
VQGIIRQAVIAAVAFVAFGVSQAGARNDALDMPIAEALATPDAQQKLDGSVKFFFGETAHPAVVHSFGILVANEKTNSLNKSAKRGCEWAFLSALVKFQRRATQLGANAVVNIHSYYDKQDISSETSFQCHDGFLITGVALRGDFVKIADH